MFLYWFVSRVWSVRYNHFHDQLILSSSSDSRVILNNIVSLSSEPYGHLVENDEDSDEDQDRYLSCLMRKPTMFFNRSDTNQAVQAQKITEGWKF